MPISKIKTSGIEDSSVTATQLADNSVTSAKIGVDVIVAEDIAANAITVSEIQNGAVTSAKLDTNIDIAGTLDVTGNLTADSGLKLPQSSGGVYTITGTDTASNRTLTLPDESGTVLTSGSSHLMIDSFYVTSSQVLTDTSQVIGVDDSLTWTHDTNTYFGSKGTGMTESSGTFTFPSTGIYKISGQLSMDSDNSDSNVYSQLQGSTDGGSTWFSMRYGSDYSTAGGQNTSHPLLDFFKVSDTSNDKIRLVFSGATGATALGSRFYSYVIFEKVGEV